MNIDKFYEMLYKLYAEQENLKIEYKLFYFNENVSNG
jgi:hypothetical protein